MIDSKTHFSAAMMVALKLTDTVLAMDLVFLLPFWSLGFIFTYKTFAILELCTFVGSIGSTFCAIRHRCHSKHVLESKHYIIRTVYLCLKTQDCDATSTLVMARALRVTNDLAEK